MNINCFYLDFLNSKTDSRLECIDFVSMKSTVSYNVDLRRHWPVTFQGHHMSLPLEDLLGCEYITLTVAVFVVCPLNKNLVWMTQTRLGGIKNAILQTA